MEYLTTNQAGQIMRLALDESRQYFATAFTHYLLILTHEENSTTGTDLAQVVTIVNENQRITTLTVTTAGLTLAGRYRYYVYGQNSAVNLNPNDASVVGLCRIGWAVMSDATTFYDIPTITINDDIIYNG
jgi:magnesium-transporting ATPase (P-type)